MRLLRFWHHDGRFQRLADLRRYVPRLLSRPKRELWVRARGLDSKSSLRSPVISRTQQLSFIALQELMKVQLFRHKNEWHLIQSQRFGLSRLRRFSWLRYSARYLSVNFRSQKCHLFSRHLSSHGTKRAQKLFYFNAVDPDWRREMNATIIAEKWIQEIAVLGHSFTLAKTA